MNLIPAIDLDKNFGQGGSLIVKGTAEVNEKHANTALGKSRNSKVVLLKGEVEGI